MLSWAQPEEGNAMSEREIRSLLRIICDELDVRAAKAGRVARKIVLPTMLGAGLALSGGCDDGAEKTDSQVITEAGPLYMAPVDAAYMAPDTTTDGAVPMPDMMYMGPDVGQIDAALDAPPVPPYTAPDAGE
jgi:hypothetical protein